MDLKDTIAEWLSNINAKSEKTAQLAPQVPQVSQVSQATDDDDPPMPPGRLMIDAKATRQSILDSVKDAVIKRFPIENDKYRLELRDVEYEGPTTYNLAQQKQAILHNRKLGCSLTGTWRLIDKSTGKVLEEKRDSVMRVPYYTNRGTIINNGSEYTVISQARLSPGVYTRRKQNGDLESQFNVSTGSGFRIELDKGTGRMSMRMGQANIPLYPVLKAFGVTDDQIKKSWGSDVAYANANKNDPKAFQKLYNKVAGFYADPLMTPEGQVKYVKDAMAKFGLDPNTVVRTLGIENVTGVTPEVILRASQKLLNVNRGVEDPDNRDNPRFSKFYGIEHILAERISKDSAKLLKPMLFRVGRDKSLNRVGRNALGGYIDDFLSTSGLAQPGEEANPMSILVQQSRITRTGEGGISSGDMITTEARGVQGDYLGFVDPIAGPECMPRGCQVFTKNGWKNWEETSSSTEFACMVDGRLEFHTPYAHHVHDYDGDLFCARSKFISYRYTPNHRMYVRPADSGSNYRFEFAKSVHGRRRQLMTGGHLAYKGTGTEYFELPSIDISSNNQKVFRPINMDDWAEFIGWYLSEGSCTVKNGKTSKSNRYIVYIQQEKYTDRLIECMSRLPFKYGNLYHNGKSVAGVWITGKQLAVYLQKFGKSCDKYIPEYFFDAPESARRRLLDGLMLGDGRKKRDTWTYMTVSRQLALDVERLGFGLGYSVHVRFERDDRPQSNYGGTYAVHFCKLNCREVIYGNKYHEECFYKEYYNGKVYCADVPGHMLFVRSSSDSIGHWTGNSSNSGIDVRASYGTVIGKDNKLYNIFRNLKTGKKEYLSLDAAADKVIAFPGQDPKSPYLFCMKNGVPVKVKTSEVDYMVPSMSRMFGAGINMNPTPTAVFGMRSFYSSKFWEQYLPQKKGDTPMVDTLMPDGKLTFNEYYGRHAGCKTSPIAGTVTKVTNDEIVIQGKNGKTETVDIVKNLPYNRMSVTGDTEVFIRSNGNVRKIAIRDYSASDGDEVLSYDPATMRSAWSRIRGFVRHDNTKRLLRVSFKSGRHVDVTEDHSLITLSDDFRLVPIYPAQCVIGKTKVPIVYGHESKDNFWTYDMGVADGLYLSEGSIHKQRSNHDFYSVCSIACLPLERRKFIFGLFERLGYRVQKSSLNEPSRSSRVLKSTDRKIEGESARVTLTSRDLAERWHSDFGHLAEGKFIAGHVFGRGSAYLHGLLAGYMAGDGCLNSDVNGAVQIEAYSVSRQLRDDLVSVCTLLGISTTIKNRRSNGIGCLDIYGFRVSTSSALSVTPLFAYPDRQSKLEYLEAKTASMTTNRHKSTSLDLIPVNTRAARKYLYSCAFGSASHYVYKTACKGSVSKNKIACYGGRAGLLGRSDIQWDTVSNIVEIPHQDSVYDFSVYESEAFALSNGILVHNTSLSYFPTVKKGQEVGAGDILAHSNFTDPTTGAFNMGQNLKVAVMTSPRGVSSFEDAIVISEDAAKKLATARTYNYEQSTSDGININKNKYLAAFPKTFTKDQAELLDDNGVVKVGTELHRGDPIMVAIGPKVLSAENAQLGKLSSVLKNAVTDKSQTWNHDWPGVVTDVVVGPSGAKVLINSEPPIKVGDKLCYDEETEVLTSHGWKFIKDVTLEDNVATLNPETFEFDYLKPEMVRRYEHKGRMYSLKTSSLDLVVTDNHRMFVQRRYHTGYEFVEANDVFGKRVSYKKDGVWSGTEIDTFTFPAYQIGNRWGLITKPEVTVSMDTFLMILGMFLSEGSCYASVEDGNCSGSGISIAQKKPATVRQGLSALEASGIEFTYRKDCGFRIPGRHLYNYFSQFGHAWEKYIPEFVFGLSVRQQKILFKWLMWGYGYSKDGMPKSYTTTSKRLADDIQRLCLHIGIAGRVVDKDNTGTEHGHIDGRTIVTKHDCYCVQIINSKLTPTVNHSHVGSQHTQEEKYIDYDGYVYCCTMPKWHAIYVRRNGHACWCGNSPRYALKGVVGGIIPMDKMPRDAVTNEPYDMLVNPMGFLSRIAPGQLMEISLGKVAKKTGKKFRIPQMPPPEGWLNWTKKQLADNGVSETADVFDPQTGRIIKGVGDGYMYVQAMHHLAEKKFSARGIEGGYTQDEQPAKGGVDGAKRISGFDGQALLSHGATEVMKDAITVRGTKNEEYWRKLRLGLPIPEPDVPFIYKKFINNLKAGGINVVEKGDITSIMPQTDKDIEKLSEGRIIDSSQMVDSSFDPVKGGLFDLGKTGGMGGTRWSMIELPEPVPNPVMEEPVRRVLGLTSKELSNILSGSEQLNGKTGGTAVKEALKNLDVDAMIYQARNDIKRKRGSTRDNAVKVLGYLTAAKSMNMNPEEWMISKVPVIPPAFRPISKVGDTALIPDTNELYKELIETKHNYEILKDDLPTSALTEERLNIYKAVKAAFGLGNSVTVEGQAKNLKGPIKQVIGIVPKWGQFQSKVIAKNQDLVGRGVTIPDKNLDMDQIGIPEDMAWTMYKPFVNRGLVQRGYSPVDALKMIDERTSTARHILEDVMAEKPVLMDRAPTWHKFNIMAFKPFITDGKEIRICPMIDSGFNMDHDGDLQIGQIRVKISENDILKLIEKNPNSPYCISMTNMLYFMRRMNKECNDA